MQVVKSIAAQWQNHWMATASARWGIPVLLALVTTIVYANSFPGAFILDDLYIAQVNPLVNHPDLAKIFTSDYWYGKSNTGLYRPLTILSLAINRYIFGPGPLGFHAVNVVLHAAVTVLLFCLLRTWADGRCLAASIAAAMFAVHPIHTEVVDEVVGRSELLVATLLLIAFILSQQRGSVARIMVCICYFLALLAKEHAITFLFLLPCADVFFLGSCRACKERWTLYAGLIFLTVFWLLWVRFGIVNPLPRSPYAEAVTPLAFVDDTTRILTATLLQWVYLLKLVIPVGLQGVYSVADMPEFIHSFLDPRALFVAISTLSLITLLGWGWSRRYLPALFGILYLVAFLPTANLVFPIGVTMAERLTYFPSVWFCAGFGTLTSGILVDHRLQRWGWALLVCYICVLGWGTVRRNDDFASELRLWSAEVVNNPRDFLGWQNLADSLFIEGNYEEADVAYRWMLHFAPDYPGGLRGRTIFFLRQNRYAEALPSARRAHILSQEHNDAIGEAFDELALAEIYLGLGDCAQALTYLEGAARMLRGQLRYADLHVSVLSCLGRDRAVLEVLDTIDRNLLGSEHHYQYGLSLARLGRFSEARTHLQAAVDAAGGAIVWNLLGLVCVQMNDRDAAAIAFTKAAELGRE